MRERFGFARIQVFICIIWLVDLDIKCRILNEPSGLSLQRQWCDCIVFFKWSSCWSWNTFFMTCMCIVIKKWKEWFQIWVNVKEIEWLLISLDLFTCSTTWLHYILRFIYMIIKTKKFMKQWSVKWHEDMFY